MGRLTDESALSLARAIELDCDEGRFAGGYARWAGSGTQGWEHPALAVQAARVIDDAGDHERARRILCRARLRAPRDPELAGTWMWLARVERGPLLAWEIWRRWSGRIAECGGPSAAAWWSGGARVCLDVGDILQARRLAARALELAPDDPWASLIEVEALAAETRGAEARARVLELANRFPRARSVAHRVIEVYVGTEGRQEAIEFAREAITRIDASSLRLALAALLGVANRPQEALARLKEVEDSQPLLSGVHRDRLLRLRAVFLREIGDDAQAQPLHRALGGAFHLGVADALREATPEARRVRLSVPFVEQGLDMCVPATLAMLSRFFGRNTTQLDIAAQVCFAGTSAHSEREWAEENGWHIVEFTVDEPTHRALIDRQIPYQLIVTQSLSLHAVAAVGYDDRCGLILLQDPTSEGLTEASREAFFRDQATYGPRGVVLVPRDRAELLEGLTLPEVDLYEHVRLFRAALAVHDRTRAQDAFDAISAEYPAHAVTYRVLRELAAYDGNPLLLRDAAKARFERAPGDIIARADVVMTSVDDVDAEHRIELLRRFVEDDHATLADHLRLARALLEDGRLLAEGRLLARQLARAVAAPEIPSLLSQAAERSGAGADAIGWARVASTMGITDGALAAAYFNIARVRGAATDALEWLEYRARRFGGARHAHETWTTLTSALRAMGEGGRAAATLRDALAANPNEPGLCMAAFSDALDTYDTATAAQILERARDRIAPSAALRMEARLASVRREPEAALRAWTSILEREPVAEDAAASAAEVLANLRGRGAAVAFIDERRRAHPESRTLLRLRLQFGAQVDEPTRLVDFAREYLSRTPTDAWARRELALILSEQGRLVDALVEARAAVELAPWAATSHVVVAQIADIAGDRGLALASALRAVELDVDMVAAVSLYLSMARGDAAASASSSSMGVIGGVDRVPAAALSAAALGWSGDGVDGGPAHALSTAVDRVTSRVIEHALDGSAIPLLLNDARGSMGLAGERRWAEALCRARPDLVLAHSALVDALRHGDDIEAALRVSVHASERFPGSAVTWLDLGLVHIQNRDEPAAVAAFERALAIDPGYEPALRTLATLETPEAARAAAAAIDRLLDRDPRHVVGLSLRAERSGARGARAEAVATWTSVVEVAPENGEAWSALLVGPSGEADEEALSLLERVVKTHPWDIGVLLATAGALAGIDRLDRAAELCTHALAIAPTWGPTYEWLARIEAARGRVPEALKLLSSATVSPRARVSLSLRRARILWGAGQAQEALETAMDVARADPTQANAWHLAYAINATLDHKAAALECARALLQAAPEVPLAWESLADAEIGCEYFESAQQTLRGCLARWPRLGSAARKLMTALIGEGGSELPLRIRDALAEFGGALGHSARAAWTMRAAVLGGDTESMASFVESMRPELGPGADLDAWQEALRGVDGTPLRKLAHQQILGLEPRLEHVQLYGLVVEGRPRSERILLFTLIRLLRYSPEIGLALARVELEAAGDARNPWRTTAIAWLLFPSSVCDDDLFGPLSYALANSGRWAALNYWLSGLGEREGVEDYALINAFEARVRCGGLRAGCRVLALADRYEESAWTPRVRALLALSQALTGQLEAAATTAAQARTYRLSSGDQRAVEIAQWLVECADRTETIRMKRAEASASLEPYARSYGGDALLTHLRHAPASATSYVEALLSYWPTIISPLAWLGLLTFGPLFWLVRRLRRRPRGALD